MAQLNPRIVAKLKRIPDVAVAAAARAMEEGAEDIVQGMKAIAPVGNYGGAGDLRDSIGWTWGDVPEGSFVIDEIRSGRNRGDQFATLRIKIYAGNREAFYARFHEFGTVNMTANPFFFPTWRAKRAEYRKRIRAAVRAAIKEAWKNG